MSQRGWIGVLVAIWGMAIGETSVRAQANAHASPPGQGEAKTASASEAPSQAAPASEAPSQAGPASGLPPTITTWLATRRDRDGRACDLQAVVPDGDLYYLACGYAGVWAVRAGGATGQLVLQRNLGGFVSSLFGRSGQLWADVTRLSAEPIAQLTAAPGPAATTASPAPVPAGKPDSAGTAALPVAQPMLQAQPAYGRPPLPRGKVVSREGRTVMVSLGADHRLAVGDRIAFTSSSDTIDTIAVGHVDRVGGQRVRVELGVNEDVPVGTVAIPTTAVTTDSSVAPPRAGGVWDVGFMARPFVSVDNDGGGAVLEAWAGRRFAGPLHLQARIAPIGLAVGGSRTSVPVSAYVMAAWDLQLFEIGFGVGGETVNDVDLLLPPGSGITFVQHARLGALDGLNLTVYTHMVLFHSQLSLAGGRVRVQIPLGGGTWIVGGGSGGSAGAINGDVGLRALLVGNGGQDSFFLTVLAGYAEIFEEQACDLDNFSCDRNEIELGGPMLGVGGEWRL